MRGRAHRTLTTGTCRSVPACIFVPLVQRPVAHPAEHGPGGRSFGNAARVRFAAMILLTVICAVPGSAFAQFWQWNTQDSLLVSYDGGSLMNVSYTSIAAADSLHCIASGFTGTISVLNRTTDGGRSWGVVLTDTGYVHGRQEPIEYHDVAYPTPNLCIAVGDSGAIVRSGDGGATWQRIPCDARTRSGTVMNLFTVSMSDSLHGIAAGFSQVLLRTSDGGRSWQRVATPADTLPTMGIHDIACLSATTYLMALWGKQTFYMLRTEDAGATWARIEADTVQSLSFVDSLHGWGAGSGYAGNGHITDEIIIRTVDGGRTWQTLVHQPAVTLVGYLAVAFADTRNGFVTAYDGRILRTTDGGETWSRTDSIRRQLNFSARCIAYPAEGLAWAATTLGQILNFNARSADVGAVAGQDAATDLRVAPNVATGNVHLAYNLNMPASITLDVIDIRGERVLLIREGSAESGWHVEHVDVASLPAGPYWVRLRRGGRVDLQRVMVVR